MKVQVPEYNEDSSVYFSKQEMDLSELDANRPNFLG